MSTEQKSNKTYLFIIIAFIFLLISLIILGLYILNNNPKERKIKLPTIDDNTYFPEKIKDFLNNYFTDLERKYNFNEKQLKTIQFMNTTCVSDKYVDLYEFTRCLEKKICDDTSSSNKTLILNNILNNIEKNREELLYTDTVNDISGYNKGFSILLTSSCYNSDINQEQMLNKIS